MIFWVSGRTVWKIGWPGFTYQAVYKCTGIGCTGDGVPVGMHITPHFHADHAPEACLYQRLERFSERHDPFAKGYPANHAR
jgi:hypothetical protein